MADTNERSMMVLLTGVTAGVLAAFLLVVWWIHHQKRQRPGYLTLEEKYLRRTRANRRKRGIVSTLNYYRRLLVLAVTYINEKYGITIKNGIGKEEEDALRLRGVEEPVIQTLASLFRDLKAGGRARAGSLDEGRLYLLYGKLMAFYENQARGEPASPEKKEG